MIKLDYSILLVSMWAIANAEYYCQDDALRALVIAGPLLDQLHFI